MDFLKRHYEKLILLGLFVVFIGLMLHVKSILDQTRSIKESDLNLPKRSPDHEMESPENVKFNPNALWENTKMNWIKENARGGTSVVFSDLVQGFPIAACPYCALKQGAEKFTALIPFAYFSTKENPKSECPLCRHVLPMPSIQRVARSFVKTESDSDGDGILNEIEKQFGLNPEDSSDALYDNDGDGFSNYYEIANGFSPINPADHPPFWHRLRVAAIKQVPLPIRFMALTDNDRADKKEWDLQFNTPRRGRTDSSQYARIGETITIERRHYRITDIKRIKEKVELTAGNLTAQGARAVREVDKSRVYLEEEVDETDEGRRTTPDKLVMVMGQTVYSSDKRPVLEDVGRPGGELTYTLKLGERFRMGGISGKGLMIRPVEYVVKSVDAEKMTVTLTEFRGKKKADGQPEEFVIIKEGKIPPDARATEQKAPSGEMPDELPR